MLLIIQDLLLLFKQDGAAPMSSSTFLLVGEIDNNYNMEYRTGHGKKIN